ncbi:MAG: glycoside hydrolase family 3 C-terminal domain-containing protein [Candidatus Aminicenantes bacterium]|nr:glycoside hydrolase family 3 C-terminal domain-containing protein [Candidatus Aminicenantes bacterium]
MKSFVVALAVIFSAVSCARIKPKTTMLLDSSGERWVEKNLKRMTLEEKAGQLIFCRYNGLFFNRESSKFKELEELIKDVKIGGLILFLGDIYEAAYLTNTLQSMADVPLLIASDLERGLGQQLDGAVVFPPLMALGAAGSEEMAYDMGAVTAREARAVGIHMTYAPVADVNINPENPIINVRSVGESPELVGRLVCPFIRGCQENGLIATAKHFPGHGDTDLDSHTVLPTVYADRDRLEKVELYPFKKAIDAGVMAVMTAHIHLPALDPTPSLPATLSPVILTKLLRQKMGFKGLIVTDALEMGGVTTLYSPGEAAVKAVAAGVDCLLLPPEIPDVVKTLVGAVREGKLSEGRLDESVRRILTAKAKLGLHKSRLVDETSLDTVIAAPEHVQKAEALFEASLTLVKNEGNVLPVGKDGKIFVFSLSSDPGDYYAGRPFIQELEKHCPQVESFFADKFTGEEYLKEAEESMRNADAVVFTLFSRVRSQKGTVGLEERHITMINRAVEAGIPAIAVSFGSPYFIRCFPEINAYLCAYRYYEAAQKAAARAVLGMADIKGKLPVSIPGLYSIGHGLSFYVKK